MFKNEGEHKKKPNLYNIMQSDTLQTQNTYLTQTEQYKHKCSIYCRAMRFDCIKLHRYCCYCGLYLYLNKMTLL